MGRICSINEEDPKQSTAVGTSWGCVLLMWSSIGQCCWHKLALCVAHVEQYGAVLLAQAGAVCCSCRAVWGSAVGTSWRCVLLMWSSVGQCFLHKLALCVAHVEQYGAVLLAQAGVMCCSCRAV